MNPLNDLLYAFEIANVDQLVDLYDQGHLTQKEIIQLAIYFVNNLKPNHLVNGSVWNNICGIIDWSRQHHELTNKQIIYVISNIAENVSQVNQNDMFW